MKVVFDTFNSELIVELEGGVTLKEVIPSKQISELEDYWIGNDSFDVNVWLDEDIKFYRAVLYKVENDNTLTDFVMDSTIVLFK